MVGDDRVVVLPSETASVVMAGLAPAIHVLATGCASPICGVRVDARIKSGHDLSEHGASDCDADVKQAPPPRAGRRRLAPSLATQGGRGVLAHGDIRRGIP